jgi:hypothetical protein
MLTNVSGDETTSRSYVIERFLDGQDVHNDPKSMNPKPLKLIITSKKFRPWYAMITA